MTKTRDKPRADGERTVMIRHLSFPMLASFKSICCRRGHSMNHVLLEFLRDFVKPGRAKQAKEPKPRKYRKKAVRRERSIMIRHVPRDTYDHFKAVCFGRGKTANEVMVEFIRNFVAADEGRVPPEQFDGLQVIGQDEDL